MNHIKQVNSNIIEWFFVYIFQALTLPPSHVFPWRLSSILKPVSRIQILPWIAAVHSAFRSVPQHLPPSHLWNSIFPSKRGGNVNGNGNSAQTHQLLWLKCIIYTPALSSPKGSKYFFVSPSQYYGSWENPIIFCYLIQKRVFFKD